MSTIKVNTITTRSGSTITLGESGKTITLACGASQSGFGRTGTVDWCTTAKTSPFTAENAKGYFVDTSSGAVTVTLPASPTAGDIVAIADLKGTSGTNNITLGRNSSKIKGVCSDGRIQTNRESVSIIYSGSDQGWININDANVTSFGIAQSYNVEYLVVAGGGSGGASDIGGGGGAGGLRFCTSKSISVTQGVAIPITVGGGGAAVSPSGSCNARGINGSNSIFSTITSAGGGGGGAGAGVNCNSAGRAGGSGGGAGYRCKTGGAGNTPPVSPPQGNAGGGSGNASSWRQGGGGGHATAGTQGHPTPSGTAGAGGEGSPYSRLGPLAPSYGTTGPSPGRYFAGGGAGGICHPAPTLAGGSGGGGTGGTTAALATAGTANTGGGGGGGENSYSTGLSGAGGSGIVVLRYLTACGAAATGGNATGTCGSDTIKVFTSDGTFTP
tara:strand:+ start:239 stop:1564 length:1326 start_codon:yes stop_codon:yes gene_type:complete